MLFKPETKIAGLCLGGKKGASHTIGKADMSFWNSLYKVNSELYTYIKKLLDLSYVQFEDFCHMIKIQPIIAQANSDEVASVEKASTDVNTHLSIAEGIDKKNANSSNNTTTQKLYELSHRTSRVGQKSRLLILCLS